MKGQIVIADIGSRAEFDVEFDDNERGFMIHATRDATEGQWVDVEFSDQDARNLIEFLQTGLDNRNVPAMFQP